MKCEAKTMTGEGSGRGGGVAYALDTGTSGAGDGGGSMGGMPSMPVVIQLRYHSHEPWRRMRGREGADKNVKRWNAFCCEGRRAGNTDRPAVLSRLRKARPNKYLYIWNE